MEWTVAAEPSDSTPFAREFVTLSRQEHIQLVWEARHWKRMHHSAAERSAEVEEDYRRRLQSQREAADERERALRGELEQARGRIRDLEQRLLGRKSERGAVIEAQQQPAGRAIRRRGQQREHDQYS